MIYKVSYVVMGGEHPGGIMNHIQRPEVGDRVEIGKMTFKIIEIHEVMPPRGDFQFLHATVNPVSTAELESESDDA
ncbi:MAG: hypothetical protein JW910_07005 [Anaerolineae bacterium]|nr:hypothetical protein [Anaerolineae bacterium]